eukprot:scaffold26038_cov230-Cylindrotheca_fusiformis.AAC.2
MDEDNSGTGARDMCIGYVETTQPRGLTKAYKTKDGRFQLVPETFTCSRVDIRQFHTAMFCVGTNLS